MVVKHHQNRHKIHRRCTFIHSNHNWKYFCKPTFTCVHIGQDGIIVLNLTIYYIQGGLIDIATIKVKFYLHCHIQSLWLGYIYYYLNMFPYLYTALDVKRLIVLVQSHFPIIYGLNKPSQNAYFSMVLSYKIGSGGVEKYYKLLLKQLKNDLLLT